MEITPPAAASSTNVTLPNSAGTLLLDDGSAASLTQIPAANIVGVATGGFGNGILQVVQNTKTDTASASAGLAVVMNFDSTFSQAITPTFSSSKIEVSFNLSVALSSNEDLLMFRLRRKIGSGSFADVTDAVGDTAASRFRCMHAVDSGVNTYKMPTINLNFLDSPNTTDAVTYSFSVAHDSGSTRTFYLNRGENDTSSYAYVARGMSSIILREVAP